LRFIVFGDSKGKEKGINVTSLKAILKVSSTLNPKADFVVVCGDSVAGSNKEDVLASQLKTFRALVEQYHPNKPIIPVVGNHEVNIEPIDDRYEKVFSSIYSDVAPDNFLMGYNNSVYYKDFGDSRLIVLNAFHYGETHRISPLQLKWFKEVSYKYKKNKFVFVHSPAFPTGAHFNHCLDLYPKERDAFWRIVNSANIDIVFSGHEHNYSRRVINSSFNKSSALYTKSIYQIITGGGGEKLRNKYTSKEGVVVAPIDTYHFLVVDVEKDCIKVSAISSKNKLIDEFSIEKPSL